MKKLKILLTALFACLFCLSFAACSSASLVENSFEYELEYSFYDYTNDHIYAHGSFKVKLPTADKYEVEYMIMLYDGDGKVLKREKYNSIVSGLGEKTINFSEGFSFEELPETNKDKCTLRLYGVSIKEKEIENPYKGYAIGFGVTGGVILLCAVMCFVVLKVMKK